MQTLHARGAERVTSILADQLASMSHDVHVICTGFDRGQEFPMSDHVHLEFIPEVSGNRLYLMFIRINFIRQRIKELQPDCILSLAGVRTLFMITAAHIGFSIPLIYSERHDPAHNPKPVYQRILRLICYHACDHVVFQTEGARDYFPTSISRKGTIIANPIKEDLPDVWQGRRRPYIVAFCALDPQKNLSLLIRAFSRISDEFPEHRVIIYGDGDIKDALKHEADQLHLSSRIVFRPHTLNVHQLVNDCSMFVSSSDYEGQSNSMLEAMAMGLPCVCTDCPCGGARAVIQHGVNGLLVPVRDEARLARAMRYMLKYPSKARKMGERASSIRLERQPRTIAMQWNRLIERAVSEKQRD